MKSRKGICTQALAARFRLRCESARARALEFGRDSFRVSSPRLPDCRTLDAAVLQLLSRGVERAEITHFRGHAFVARLWFCRSGCEDGCDA